jgi:hypothetical protein
MAGERICSTEEQMTTVNSNATYGDNKKAARLGAA